jgi:hypothetical protein
VQRQVQRLQPAPVPRVASAAATAAAAAAAATTTSPRQQPANALSATPDAWSYALDEHELWRDVGCPGRAWRFQPSVPAHDRQERAQALSGAALVYDKHANFFPPISSIAYAMPGKKVAFTTVDVERGSGTRTSTSHGRKDEVGGSKDDGLSLYSKAAVGSLQGSSFHGAPYGLKNAKVRGGHVVLPRGGHELARRRGRLRLNTSERARLLIRRTHGCVQSACASQ